MQALFLVILLCAPAFSLERAHIYRQVGHALNSTLPSPSIANVTDCGHADFLSLNAPNNIFTQADADKLDRDTEEFMMEFYGYNFSLSNPNIVNDVTNCRRILMVNNTPFMMMIPFKENYNFTIFVYDDTKYPLRGSTLQPEWVQVVYSNLLIFLQSGTVTSGRSAGQMFLSQWAITYGYSYYVRAGYDLRLSWNIEKFLMRSTRIGPGQLNAYGTYQYAPPVELTDEDGRTCIYWDNSQQDFYWGANNTGIKTRTSGDFIICPK